MRLFCIAQQVGLAEVSLGLLVQDCLVSQDTQDTQVTQDPKDLQDHLVKKDLLDDKDPKGDKDSKDNQVRFKDCCKALALASEDLDLLEYEDQFYQVHTIVSNLLVH